MEELLILQRERSFKNVGGAPRPSRHSRAPPWPTENTRIYIYIYIKPFSAQWTTNYEDSADVEECRLSPLTPEKSAYSR